MLFFPLETKGKVPTKSANGDLYLRANTDFGFSQ